MITMVTTGCLSLLFAFVEASEKGNAFFTDLSEVNPVTVICVASVSILLLVFILSLCGGCTPMEVGSDQHEASGGRKSYNQYNSVATDVNTQVMSAGTTLPNDPYRPNEQSLPYPLHPQTVNTFTGYQTQDQNCGTELSQNRGYQTAGSQVPTGAHRHFAESESPPPAYSEAVGSQGPQPGGGQGHYGGQPSAPAQPYGW